MIADIASDVESIRSSESAVAMAPKKLVSATTTTFSPLDILMPQEDRLRRFKAFSDLFERISHQAHLLRRESQQAG